MKVTLNFESGVPTCQVDLRHDDGSEVHKAVLNSAVIKVFLNTVTTDRYYPVPDYLRKTLPEEKPYIEGLVYGCQDQCTVTGIFFVPGEKRFMNFSGEELCIPYPSCLFLLTAKNGTLYKSYCFAVKEHDMESLGSATTLYAFPFGNVNPNNAAICWGTNTFKALTSYMDLKTAVITFFSSESNADYVKSGTSFQGFSDYRTFLSDLCERHTFPEKTLVQTPYAPTLGDLLKKFEVS